MAHGNFDFKSDLDFPSLSSNAAPTKKTAPSPPEKTTNAPLPNGNNKENNARSTSKGRGKKQSWKAVHVEFNNGNGGQRFQPRGNPRPRFGSSSVNPKHASDDPPFEFSYRGYRSGSRSRIRRGRGGSAPHHFGRPNSAESTTPISNSPTSDLSPTIMAIPYHPNYTAFVQPHVSAVPIESTPADIEDAIRHQIEYYFSEENLIKDNYMRLNMSSEGFLSIQLISNFNKIKQFNVDIETITRAIEVSDKLEVVDGKIVRPVIDPLRWPLRSPLPPPIIKNYIPPEVIVAPIQPNGVLYPEVVPEMDTGDLMYHPILAGPEDIAYQNVDETIDNLTGYMNNVTFEDKAVYGYYPVEMPEETVVNGDYDPCYDTLDSQQPENDLVVEPKDTQPEEVVLENGCHDKDIAEDDASPETITDKVTYTIYSTDSNDLSHCQNEISSFQQESMRCQQEVGRYQHMLAYVSS